MNKFVFILLSIICAGLSTAVITAIVSYIYTLSHPDHPHAIVPSWMIMFVVGFIIAAIVGIIWTSISILYKGQTHYTLTKMVLGITSVALGITGAISLYFMIKS